jgi:outer membrane receptor for ferric coprogen and ferric-rhodotorulic acid
MTKRRIGKTKVRGKKLLCIMVITVVWTPNCSAAAPPRDPVKYSLKIDGQPLGQALQEFARQSGVQIIFFSQVTEGLQSSPLDGQYTIAAALETLLKGSNLTFRVINAKTIEIRPLAATNSLDAAADRSGAAPNIARLPGGGSHLAQQRTTVDPAALEELVVNGTAEGLVATRTQTPLREIPQTVSVIPREQIRQQNDTDLADALANAVGITAVQSTSLDRTFISRGFTVTTFHLDGGAVLNSFGNTPFFGTPDLGEFDHIEVLRGSDALFGGIGNPGATVSMVRKRPLDTSGVAFNASLGSWNNYRVEADVTGPLALDGTLRGRLDIVYAHRDYFYDTASLEKKKLFGALEYDLSGHTLLTIGGSYQRDNALPFIVGLPFYEDGSDPRLPRRTALAFDWSRYDTQTREIYAQLQQVFGGAWKFKMSATSLDASAEYGYGLFGSPIDPITKSLPVLPRALFSPEPNTQDQFAFDATLTGRFECFGQRIDLAIGGDYTHFKGNVSVDFVDGFEPGVSNVFAYNPAAYPNPPPPQSAPLISLGASNQSGVFASSRVYLGDTWSVVGGARVSSNRSSNRLVTGFPGSTVSTTRVVKDTGKVTPYAGVMYAFANNYSVYASYADIFQSNGGLRQIGGALLPPADGVDLEAGIKGAWRNGALNGSVVLYQIDQHGLAVDDPNATIIDRLRFSPCCALSNGRNKSKGADAEVSGTPASGWLIGAGYSFNINHGEFGGDLSSSTPRHLLKLWTSNELSGRWQRWTVGGSLQAQSGNFMAGTYCPQPDHLGNCAGPFEYFKNVQGSYAAASLRVAYRIDRHWRAALTINNVFDRVYYQTVGSPDGGNWYGEPRNFMLRFDGSY